ncbi:hypothetical protein VTN00DRAFT_5849 [Thermoascus crustaceus]|uniref:uncharacterized protein n=1 Tax=Thermoascus crustaceus TaxID=5088 RepID=UPI0037437CD2
MAFELFCSQDAWATPSSNCRDEGSSVIFPMACIRLEVFHVSSQLRRHARATMRIELATPPVVQVRALFASKVAHTRWERESRRLLAGGGITAKPRADEVYRRFMHVFPGLESHLC